MKKIQKTALSGSQFNKSLKKILTRNETIIVFSIVALSIVIGSINNAFFTMGTLFETLKACVVPGILAIGVGIVMINGGVDLSGMAIAIFSAYSAITIILQLNLEVPVIVIFLLAMAIGAVLGLLNGLFIAFFKIPIFIATLCTGVIFKGIMLEFIGNIYITPAQMPQSGLDFSRSTVFGGLHSSVFILIGLLVVAHVLLKYTIFGRGVFASGGAPESAARIGYNIKRLNFRLFVYAGIMYAAGGVVYVLNSRLADPYDLVGTELSVIAAVVLGGISIAGGKGSVFGMFLGTLLTVIIRNNLILIGISSDWTNFVFGFIFILAIGIQAYNQVRVQKERV